MATYWENSCSFGLRYASWYKCLIVSLVFSHLGFWSGNLFLIAPFPDLCLLVPFYRTNMNRNIHFFFMLNNHGVLQKISIVNIVFWTTICKKNKNIYMPSVELEPRATDWTANSLSITLERRLSIGNCIRM